ncbi:MAG: hypothetical protein ABH803_03460 [Candidatus Micrarchaeota archaeon]
MVSANFFLFLVFSAMLANAVSMNAIAEKNVFNKGENATVLVTIQSNEAVELFLEANVVGEGLPPAPKRVFLQLSANEERTISLVLFQVDDGIPPGNYEAKLRLLQDGVELTASQANFSVEGTTRHFALQVLICNDAECSTRVSVPIKGDSIFLKPVLNPQTEGVLVNAVVEKPDGSEAKLVLPSELRLLAAGTYEISASAEKAGFETASFSSELIVLEKPFDFNEKASEEPKTSSFDYGFIFIGLLVIVLIVLVYLKLIKKRG